MDREIIPLNALDDRVILMTADTMSDALVK